MHDIGILGFTVILIVLILAWNCFLAYNRGRSVIGTILLSICLTPFVAMAFILLLGTDHWALMVRKHGKQAIEDKLASKGGL